MDKKYDREYGNGWRTATTGTDSAKWASGTSSVAWDDGYLDAAEGLAKWTRRARRLEAVAA